MGNLKALILISLVLHLQNTNGSPLIVHKGHSSLNANTIVPTNDKSTHFKQDLTKLDTYDRKPNTDHTPTKSVNDDKDREPFEEDYYDDDYVDKKYEPHNHDQIKYKALDEFIDAYIKNNYDEQDPSDIFEEMQGDAPVQSETSVQQSDASNYQNDEGIRDDGFEANGDEIGKRFSNFDNHPNFTHKKIVANYKNDSMGDIFIPQLNMTLSNLINSTAHSYGGQNNGAGNLTDAQIRKRYRVLAKEEWKEEIKQRILTNLFREGVLRQNNSKYVTNLKVYSNFTSLPTPVTGTTMSVSKNIPYTEKTQGFYPKCEIPRNTDLESWNHPQSMNLNFKINISTQIPGHNLVVAKATLRLYKFYQNSTLAQNVGTVNKNASESGNILDAEDKQIRVSIYWYTKSLKKHRSKRRLSDSKMVPIYENSSTNMGKWVEFNVRPATKSWIKYGRNLGLGVVVEDQEGNVLQADHFFKNLDCSLSESDENKASGYFASFKPPPRPLFEAAVLRSSTKQSVNIGNGEFDASIEDTKRNFTNSGNIYKFLLLPTIDLCVLEIPQSEKNQTSEITLQACKFHTLDFSSVNHVDVANYLYDKKYEHNGQNVDTFKETTSYAINDFKDPMSALTMHDDYLVQNDEAAESIIRSESSSTEAVSTTSNPTQHRLRHHREKSLPKNLFMHDPRDFIINRTTILTYDEILEHMKTLSNSKSSR